MYESPIKLDFTEPVIEKLKDEADQYIVRACQKMNVDVDREELIRALQYDRDQYLKGYADAVADVRPVVRGHNTGNARIFSCSECGYGIEDIFLSNEEDYSAHPNFCPNCGADMREDKDV